MKRIVLAILLPTLALVGCREDIETHEELLGKTQQQVLAEYGQPIDSATIHFTDSTYIISSFLPSIRHKLGRRNVSILELHWKFPNHRKLIVWLEQQGDAWCVLDNVEWDTSRVVF